jgi:hypothetical protein
LNSRALLEHFQWYGLLPLGKIRAHPNEDLVENIHGS